MVFCLNLLHRLSRVVGNRGNEEAKSTISQASEGLRAYLVTAASLARQVDC